jgi:hypothetical protein
LTNEYRLVELICALKTLRFIDKWYILRVVAVRYSLNRIDFNTIAVTRFSEVTRLICATQKAFMKPFNPRTSASTYARKAAPELVFFKCHALNRRA